MPLDTSMYRSQPTNVLDVIGGYQALGLNRQKKQMNALALQQEQAAMLEKQRALEEMGAIKNVLSGAGGDRARAISDLESRGYYKHADDLKKSAAEVALKEAQGKREGTQAGLDEAKAAVEKEKLLKDRFGLYRDDLARIGQSPSKDQVARWLALQYQDPITKDFVGRVPFEQAIQEVPEDPQQLSAWIQQTGMGIEKFVQNKTTQRGQDVQATTSRENNAANNARMAAEGAANRAVQMRGQNLVDARQRDNNQITKEDREATRAAEKKDKSVTEYAKTLQKEGIPDFEEALATLEDKFSKYKPGSAPGVGRGAGLVPDFLQGQEAEDMTNAIAAVKNTLLKARSGSAVSESELRRLVQELGTGGFRSEETVRNAIKSIRNRFEKVKANAVAGVSDDVKREYETRGGTPITRGGAKEQGSYTSEAEVEAAFKAGKIKRGDTVIVNGRKAVWE